MPLSETDAASAEPPVLNRARNLSPVSSPEGSAFQQRQEDALPAIEDTLANIPRELTCASLIAGEAALRLSSQGSNSGRNSSIGSGDGSISSGVNGGSSGNGAGQDRRNGQEQQEEPDSAGDNNDSGNYSDVDDAMPGIRGRGRPPKAPNNSQRHNADGTFGQGKAPLRCVSRLEKLLRDAKRKRDAIEAQSSGTEADLETASPRSTR